MVRMQVSKPADIFCNEAIIGASTVTKIGTMRVVLAKDGITTNHLLVMPIAHRNHFDELVGRERLDFEKAQGVVRQWMSGRGISSIRMVAMDGPESGSTIQHWHMHVIGVTKEDRDDEKFGLRMVSPESRPVHYSFEELPKKALEIRKEMSGTEP